MSAAGSSGGAAAAAVIQALKASGVIIKVEPEAFLELVFRYESPLVVHATSWLFGTYHQYLTSHRGLAFYARSPRPLELPDDVELIESRKIWIPGEF